MAKKPIMEWVGNLPNRNLLKGRIYAAFFLHFVRLPIQLLYVNKLSRCVILLRILISLRMNMHCKAIFLNG